MIRSSADSQGRQDDQGGDWCVYRLQRLESCTVCVNRHHYLQMQSHRVLELGGTFQIPLGLDCLSQQQQLHTSEATKLEAVISR